jgi:chromosome segregation ATPase
VFKRKIDDPIADLRRAVAELRPGQERLTVSREAKATEVRKERRRLLVERDVSDAGGATRADAAALALQSASAGIDDALAELERQLADVRLRLSPERDQAARAAEAIKRKNEAEELKQAIGAFAAVGVRLADALRQATAVSFTANETAATVVKAVSEILDATKAINEDLESYVRLVVSNSIPIRRQPMPVALMEIPASPTALPIPSSFPEEPSRPLFQVAAA